MTRKQEIREQETRKEQQGKRMQETQKFIFPTVSSQLSKSVHRQSCTMLLSQK